jgi:hypothetical protein
LLTNIFTDVLRAEIQGVDGDRWLKWQVTAIPGFTFNFMFIGLNLLPSRLVTSSVSNIIFFQTFYRYNHTQPFRMVTQFSF